MTDTTRLLPKPDAARTVVTCDCGAWWSADVYGLPLSNLGDTAEDQHAGHTQTIRPVSEP